MSASVLAVFLFARARVYQLLAVAVISTRENSGTDDDEGEYEAQEKVLGVHVDVFVDSQGASVLGGFKSLEGKDWYDC